MLTAIPARAHRAAPAFPCLPLPSPDKPPLESSLLIPVFLNDAEGPGLLNKTPRNFG